MPADPHILKRPAGLSNLKTACRPFKRENRPPALQTRKLSAGLSNLKSVCRPFKPEKCLPALQT